MSDPVAEARRLSDGDINVELSAAIFGFDPSEKYPEWSNSSMREAYRAGFEDGLRQRDAANAEVERLRATIELVREVAADSPTIVMCARILTTLEAGR